MSKKLKFNVLICGIIIGTLLTGCSNNEGKTSTKQEKPIVVKEVSYTDIKGNKNIQLIDTRDEANYIGWKNKSGISGHIKGAMDFPEKWIDLGIKQDQLDKELERRGIDKTKEVVLYSDEDLCKDVYSKFSKAGFTNIKALKGGIDQYSKDGGELERLEGYKFYVSPQWVEDLINGKKP